MTFNLSNKIINNDLQNIAEELTMKLGFWKELIQQFPNASEWEMNKMIDNEWEIWRYTNR
jgi:hypothetical protein